MTLILWAILFLVLAIGLAMVAYSGVAVAVSFFSKLTFFIAFIFLVIAIILFIIERYKLMHQHRKEKEDYLKFSQKDKE